jgi:probable phosphoglycerate mutase
MKSIRLLLIRHARTTWNAQGRIQGWADPPLDDVGYRQARALALNLKSQPIDIIYSSPLQRARITAEFLAAEQRAGKGISVRLDDRLRERQIGLLTGLTWAEATQRFPDWAARAAENGWGLHPPPEAESLADLKLRLIAALNDITRWHDGQTVAVVSHSGSLNAYLQHLLQLADDSTVRFRIPHASITHILLVNKQVLVQVIGDDRYSRSESLF